MSAPENGSRSEILERTIRGYHSIGFAEVSEAIDYLRDPGDSVIVGGSLALGLGNELSDLDVVVSGSASTESSRVPIEHWVGSLRVDVWKLAQAAIDELFERAETRLASDAPIEGAFGDIYEEADLKLLHRVASGIVLDGPPLRPAATRGYDEIARDLLVREYAERMRESALVALLGLDAGDRIASTFNARLAIQSALHATLAARGLPFTGDKWLYDRVSVDQPDLAEIHESFAILPTDEAAAAEFVRGAVAACEQLSRRDLSIEALAADARWERGDLELFHVGDEHFAISREKKGLWALDDADAAAWAALDDEGPWPIAAPDEATARLAFGLYALGVVELRWNRGLLVEELQFGGEPS